MSNSGGASGGGVASTLTHITAAQILTSHTTPVTVVPAPGANEMLMQIGETAEYVPGAGSYVVAGAGIYYTNGASADNPFAFVNHVFLGDAPVHDVDIPAYAGMHDAKTAFTNAPLVFASSVSDPTSVGPITAATLQAGGNGYAPNDTGTINTDLYTGGATYKVLTVGGGGAVLTFQITAGGDGYSTVDNPLATTVGGAQPGSGSGFTVNVTTVTPTTGDLYVTTLYQKVTTH